MVKIEPVMVRVSVQNEGARAQRDLFAAKERYCFIQLFFVDVQIEFRARCSEAA